MNVGPEQGRIYQGFVCTATRPWPAGLDGIVARIQLHTSRTRKLDIKFKYHEEPVSLTNSLGPDCSLTLK